jgi:hypothetical protein
MSDNVSDRSCDDGSGGCASEEDDKGRMTGCEDVEGGCVTASSSTCFRNLEEGPAVEVLSIKTHECG